LHSQSPEHPEATYTVASRSELAAVQDMPRSRFSRVRIRLVLPREAHADGEELERRLVKQQSACGCDQGSLAGVLYLVAMGVGLALGLVSPGSILAWGALVAGLFVALLAGKMIGLAFARWKTRSLLSELASLLPDHPRPSNG
jgi:hypothetical protein